MAKCQDCGKNEATIHLTQIVNNEKTTLSICNECAAKRKFSSPLDTIPFPLAEVLSGIASNLPLLKQPEKMESISCVKCGLTFERFTRQGRFGCGECYDSFRNLIEPIMRKIHGASLHRGRTPDANPVTGDLGFAIKEEERLQVALQKAIESEDFERAAEIRDKLKSFRETHAAVNHEVEK